MPVDEQVVTPDQPVTFPSTRDDALTAWAAFLPDVPAYADGRNHVRPGHRAVSRLSPAIRHRLLTEHELIAATLAAHPFPSVEKFVQELLWRRYWKSWLELRPAVWDDYRGDVQRLRTDLRGFQAKRVAEIEVGQSGVGIIDHFAHELTTTGYLHNHARMWFAGYWVHTERLPWQLGADFFYRHLLDADPASNTLSWRWVAGIQTRGKPYLTCRSNVEKYAAELVARYPDGLDRLGDATARPAPVDAPDLPPPAWPDDADDESLPESLPARVGLWVHPDDLSADTAHVLQPLRPAAVFGGFDDVGAGHLRRAYAATALSDGLSRAAVRFAAEATDAADANLATAISAWAVRHALSAVVALRPAVGPWLDRVPAIRSALQGVGVTLHLVWRPEDARTLSRAESGYFKFWQGAKADLTGGGDRDARRRKRLRRQQHG